MTMRETNDRDRRRTSAAVALTGLLGLVAAAGTGAAPAPAPAPAPSIRESNEADFARALAQRGWYDLAEEVCAQLSGDSKATVPVILAEILYQQAEAEPNADKAKAAIERAIPLLEGFLKEKATHPLALNARVSIGALRKRKAHILVQSMKSETDAAKVAELRTLALRTYTDVETHYRSCVEDFKKVANQASTSEEVQNSLVEAQLDLPSALLDHARIPGMDADERKKLLEEAIQKLVDFQFDYGDRAVAYNALRVEGECYGELGQYDTAVDKLRGVFELRARLAESNRRPNDYHLGLLRQTTLVLAKVLEQRGKAAEAVTVIDQAFKDDPTLNGTPIGNILKLEKAEALFRAQRVAEANALIKQLREGDPGFAIVVDDKVKTWVTRGGGIVQPEQMLFAAESSMGKEQWHDALQMLRRCIDLCRTTEDRDRHAPVALFKMGQIYFETKRYYEAAFAYEKVFTSFPKHELAGKSCAEAVRCAATIYGLTEEKQDEALQDRYMKALSTMGGSGADIDLPKFLQALKLEASKKNKEAGELYLQISEKFEGYERCLFSGSVCLYNDAMARWREAKDPRPDALKSEVRAVLARAEDSLNRLLTRIKNPDLAPKDAEALRQREQLAFGSRQYLINIYTHEIVNRPEDGLKLLEEAAKGLPADDEKLGKILGQQVTCYLALKRLDDAIRTLDVMIDRFPYGRPIAQAAKSVAIRLDEITTELMKAKKPEDEPKIRENLKRIGSYYAKWLKEGPSNGMNVTTAEVVSVAEIMWMIAKQMNGLEPSVASFLDLKGRAIKEPRYFNDAAFIHALITESRGAKADKVGLDGMMRESRCYGFLGDWDKAKTAYDRLIKTFQVVGDNDRMNIDVLQKQPVLLSAYLESGFVYLELAMKDKVGNKFQFDNALAVFNNIVRSTSNGSEPWWLGRFGTIKTFFERGTSDDIRMAKIAMDNLERNGPDFDEGKYGMKDKFVELKGQINKVSR
jgi:tetratricopeptide (TPR) repeat protein